LIFGFSLTMESIIVGYAACWPVMIATMAATRRIKPRLLEVAAVLEMTPVERLWTIIAPAVFSRVVVGLRVAIGFALVVAVTVEILVNPRGLGYSLILAQQTFRPDLMYAHIVWLAVLGTIAGALSSQLDRFAAPGRS
jgi:NitT/TauT family transport system permease protein